MSQSPTVGVHPSLRLQARFFYPSRMDTAQTPTLFASCERNEIFLQRSRRNTHKTNTKSRKGSVLRSLPSLVHWSMSTAALGLCNIIHEGVGRQSATAVWSLQEQATGRLSNNKKGTISTRTNTWFPTHHKHHPNTWTTTAQAWAHASHSQKQTGVPHRCARRFGGGEGGGGRRASYVPNTEKEIRYGTAKGPSIHEGATLLYYRVAWITRDHAEKKRATVYQHRKQ